MYYLKDNTGILHDIIKYHVLLQRGHTETHTDTQIHTQTHTQTNKVIAITLLCKINNKLINLIHTWKASVMHCDCLRSPG